MTTPTPDERRVIDLKALDRADDERRAQVVISGVCRVCGCTDLEPCFDDETGLPCAWVDADRTLCDNVECIAVVPIGDLERMVAAN